jgi:hypothetical protein
MPPTWALCTRYNTESVLTLNRDQLTLTEMKDFNALGARLMFQGRVGMQSGRRMTAFDHHLAG